MDFFKEHTTDLTITKANFPENTLVYVDQGTVSPVKVGHAIYLEFVIIGQIMPIANPDPKIDLDNHILRTMRFCYLFLYITHKMGYIAVSRKN